MAIHKIIKYPSTSLKQPCRKVEFPLDMFVRGHINDLMETLQASPNGVALASNQILDCGYRIFVCKFPCQLPQVVINPDWWEVKNVPHPINEIAKYNVFVEGCLSIPEIAVRQDRAFHIDFKYFDSDGNEKFGEATGFDARVVQHEVDHLNGMLLSDYMPKDQQVRLRMEAIKNRKAGK